MNSKTLSDLQASLNKADELRAAGRSAADAARDAGLSRAAYYRWIKRQQESGVEGLVARKPTGRPPAFELTEEEGACLRWHNLRKNSLDLAVDDFLREEACTDEVRAALLTIKDQAAMRRKWAVYPESLRRIAFCDEALKRAFRGKKALQDAMPISRKGLFWMDEDGAPHLLEPNDLWESDDMSVNTPFRYVNPANGEFTLGRQTLLTLDVTACNFLAASPLGRERDAYRVEDIADHMRDLVTAYGMPRWWRLERGVWENNFIDGIPLDDKAMELPSDFAGKRWGGLGELFTILRTWSSRGKGTIESSFDLLQSLMDHDPRTLTIGRFRGEQEEATKQMLRAHRGMAEALDKFWDITQCADALRDAMLKFNRRPKQRRAHGKLLVVPEELYSSRPAKREVPASELWRFHPIKTWATVRGGFVQVSAKYYPAPFIFVINRADLYLNHGHRVLVAFHPGYPEKGAHIFNAEVSSSKNRHAFSFAAPICVAPYEPEAPQIGGTFSENRRGATAAVRKEFRAVQVAGQQRHQVASHGVTRDGDGISPPVEVINFTPRPAPAQIQPAASRPAAVVPMPSAAESLSELDSLLG